MLTGSNPVDCAEPGEFFWDYGANAPSTGSADDGLTFAIEEINEDAFNDLGLVDFLPSNGWYELTTPSGTAYFVYPENNWEAVIRANEIGAHSAVICPPTFDSATIDP